MRTTRMIWTAFAGGLLTALYLKRRHSPKGVMARMKEKEDIDAYNAEDMQPPFEEKTPRQRHI